MYECMYENNRGNQEIRIQDHGQLWDWIYSIHTYILKINRFILLYSIYIYVHINMYYYKLSNNFLRWDLHLVAYAIRAYLVLHIVAVHAISNKTFISNSTQVLIISRLHFIK